MNYFKNTNKKLLFFCNPLTVTFFIIYMICKYSYFSLIGLISTSDSEKAKQLENQIPIFTVCLIFAIACSLIFPMDGIMNVSTQLSVKIAESWIAQLTS